MRFFVSIVGFLVPCRPQQGVSSNGWKFRLHCLGALPIFAVFLAISNGCQKGAEDSSSVEKRAVEKSTTAADLGGPGHEASSGNEATETRSEVSPSEDTDAVHSDPVNSDTVPSTAPNVLPNAVHGAQASNHLAGESSPYLRMHVHNPVDWYPWGEEALKKARDENKLIFLSIGYSSCYWCHVMERESFMDDEIAAFLNENFVCIKVDREERPDLDSIYMLAVQLMTRRGGWPMSVFLTPEAHPFFGGTYFPARDGDRPGSPGFLTVIQKLHTFWKQQPEQARETATAVTDAIRTEMQGTTVSADTKVDGQLVESLKQVLARDFDPQYGGFSFDPNDSQRPKFPEASNLMFLLDCVQRTADENCKKMLLLTLDAMAQGGIWDHVGGGFHRYSTDRFWTIPHFEKMLYDNGQLLSVYSWAYQQTGREEYRLIADHIATWLQREMLDVGGGYYAALDAESEREEGKYYRWTKEELQSNLGDDYALWTPIYGLNEPPNFEGEYVVLRLGKSWTDVAAEQNQSIVDVDARLARGRTHLLSARQQRVRPLTDQKVLCSWNGLVIRGLADAGYYGKRSEHIQAATKAAEFVLKNLRDEQGRLLRTYSEGRAKLTAYLDDYAFLIDALIGLHRATGDARWLEEADKLMQLQITWYADESQAGFFFTANDHNSPLVRAKLWGDEAVPSGNSVSANNLLYLAQHLQRPEYKTRAEQLVLQGMPMMQQFPRIAPRLAVALHELTASP